MCNIIIHQASSLQGHKKVSVSNVILFSVCNISAAAPLHAVADAGKMSCDISLPAFRAEPVNSS